MITLPTPRPTIAADPLAGPDPRSHPARRTAAPDSWPLLVGGAVAASALSLAGAAWVAWRASTRSRIADGPRRARGAWPRARSTHAMRGRPAEVRPDADQAAVVPRPRKDAYPADLWTKCPSCERCCSTSSSTRPNASARPAAITSASRPRLASTLLVDDGTFDEHDAGLQCVDALGFVDQKAVPGPARRGATGDRHARRRGLGHRRRSTATRVALCVMDFGVHGRVDGRRRRREGHPGGRAGPGRSGAADHRLAPPAARGCRRARSR